VVQIEENEIEVIHQEMKKRADVLNKRMASNREEHNKKDKEKESSGKG
jgi:hypothetical protein